MIDLTEVEARVYSQNGEDGIVEFLLVRVREPDRRFLEIGAGGGAENNTNALAARGYSGIAVEAKATRARRHRDWLVERGWGSRVRNLALKIDSSNVAQLLTQLPTLNPDFFSLDIDGLDWHVWQALARAGLRPKLLCLEYNPSFLDHPATVPATWRRVDALRNLYFGCGLQLWRRTLEPDWRFVTVCSAGINAFFIDPSAIDNSGLDEVSWCANADCPALAALEGRLGDRWAKLSRMPLHHFVEPDPA